MPRKKNFWKGKGPLIGFTFGDILQGVLIAILIGVVMYYFMTVELTTETAFYIIIACFIGIVIAKIIQDVSRYKMK